MSFQITIFFCFAIITAALGKSYRIVGGSTTDISEHPHQVSLRHYSINEHFCSGSIVSDKHILTAAHCFYQRYSTYDDVRVFVGTNSPYSTSGKRFRIDHVHIHPLYTGKVTQVEAWIYDLAVIKLKKSIEFGQIQNKIELPTGDIQIGGNVVITGYGKTSHLSLLLSDTLQKATMRVIDSATCSDKLKRTIQNTQACLSHTAGVGACHGDSGGPVTMNGKLVGIQSWVVPCAQASPDVFTNVFSHLQFIRSKILL